MKGLQPCICLEDFLRKMLAELKKSCSKKAGCAFAASHLCRLFCAGPDLTNEDEVIIGTLPPLTGSTQVIVVDTGLRPHLSWVAGLA